MSYEVAPFGRFEVWGVRRECGSVEGDVREDEGAVNVAFLALVAHHETGMQSHISKRLVQVPCHAETRTAAHPRIDIVPVAIIEIPCSGGAARRFQAYDFREVLVRHVREFVTQVENLLPGRGFHKEKDRK